ncbi:mitochondrial FAD carrier protein flx1 [Malassezia nana]|uniref:Mitochondrial FAD carrier protein flx1 n=1 Tax=Malassezia nana TaxID=180528 RepID=A0AAF0EMU3_9BASI|nr:mitochondrial FAD carrier protein flx1 [Malassezia nana]
MPQDTAPSYFSTPAVDHAVAGMVAGTISTLCMNPLDLVKTRFQVNQSTFTSDVAARSMFYQKVAQRRWLYYLMGGKPGVDIVDALVGITKESGWWGLYRGVVPNIVGNASSWGLYFLWYTMIKEHMTRRHDDATPRPLSAGEHLLAATESGVITAIMTNPLWVIKTRMFTTTATPRPPLRPDAGGTIGTVGAPWRAGSQPPAPVAYRGLWHGLCHTLQTEGLAGWYRGVGLAILGVSNGAIQFMAYEQLKQWRTAVTLQRQTGRRTFSEAELESVQLRNSEYTLLSGAAKLFSITLTYPYQVVRSRMQNHVTSHLYPTTWSCVVRMFRDEGPRAFYRGFATNALRILPGTCVTFVAYENVSWLLRAAAR